MPLVEAGTQPVVLRVYDAAGNYIEKSTVVTVNPAPKE
jgi:hypothetical protein